MEKIVIGVSTCLLGKKVRYDGDHSQDPFLTGTLGQQVEYIPVCPEVECGLPVPREAMHLEGDPDSPRLMTIATRQDMTDRLETWARHRVAELEKHNLSGFIFKSRSPSCGMEQVKLYNEEGAFLLKGIGLFARIFMEHFPLLPVADETRLNDPHLREHFIKLVSARPPRLFVDKAD